MITDRFGLFADIGIYYDIENDRFEQYDTSGTKTIDTSNDVKTINTTTSGLGVLFYF